MQKMHKKKKRQKKRKFVLSVWSVWSVVFVGTTEYTEYTEGRALRRVFSTSLCPIIQYLRQSAVSFLAFLAVQSNQCPSVFIRGSSAALWLNIHPVG
ncbi:MAG: hypothetical protein ACOYCD_09850 [Kiritimatiellia bacterium]